MYHHFIEALNKKYNCVSQSDLSGMDLQHYIFASTSNKRGQSALNVFEAYGFSLQGLKILDVGCAYGGFSIEAAKCGSVCYGIEISEALYNFAVLNGKDEQYETGSCEFLHLDALSTDFVDKIPNNFFDLIIVNDVFEHVYDTVQLLSNLSKVANENCAIYFAIPNGNEPRSVAKEGHSGLCGIGLVDPLLWFTLMGKQQRSIYYRQFEYYKALFSYFGFSKINLTNYPVWASSVELEQIESQFIATKNAVCEAYNILPEKYVSWLSKAFDKYEKQFNADKALLSDQEMCWKYSVRIWTGFAHKEKWASDSERLRTTSKRSHTSDINEKYNVSFTLSLNGSTLAMEVDCVAKSKLDFEFHLMTRGESIRKGRWQSEPYCEWELSGAGMYSVAIYIKDKQLEKHEYCIKTAPLYYENKE